MGDFTQNSGMALRRVTPKMLAALAGPA